MIKIKEKDVKCILTKTRIPGGDYVINPYFGCTNGCKYCYASFMKRFLQMKEAWGDFLIVKKLTKPLEPDKLTNHTINIGTVTDGYVWQEKEFEITRSILKQLVNVRCKVIILTKNDLVLRDIDLLEKMHDVTVAFSINTTNESFKQAMDRASPIKNRMKALKTLHEHNIKTAVFISPVFPEITDWWNIIKQTKSYVKDFWFEDLNLRQPFKGNIMKYIEEQHSNLIPLYDEIYNRGNIDYWKNETKKIDEFCKLEKVNFINFFHHALLRKS